MTGVNAMRKIYKFITLFCAVLQLTGLSSHAEAAQPTVSAEAAVLIEAESGQVIYQKSAETIHSMASTTKIMTALVALETTPLDKVVITSEKAVGVEGSSIYLGKDERLTMEDLLYALMLQSANDAATAIAIDIAGSEEEFASLMNAKASELGLVNTHFTNPHGLDHAEHYTTALDLGRLACYALKNDTFSTIVSTYKHHIPLKDGDGVRMLVNHNRMLKMYDGTIGVKTGFTKKSGRCLVTAAERNGVKLVAVTLNAPDDWNDHSKMLDYGFAMYESVLLSMDGEQSFVFPVVGGTVSEINARNHGELRVILPKEGQKITRVNELKSFYWAPISAGDVLGRVVYYNNGVEIGSVDIIAEADVARIPSEKSLLDRFKAIFGK